MRISQAAHLFILRLISITVFTMNLLSVNSTLITLITLIIVPLAVAILLPIFIKGISAWHRKVLDKQENKTDSTSFKVKYNALVIGLWIFLVAFMLAAASLFPILYLCDLPDDPPIGAVIGASALFGVLAIISGVFLYAFKRYEIGVSEEGIKVVPLFGKSREYGWQDLSFVKKFVAFQDYSYKVYVKQKDKAAFQFTSVMVGGKKLEEELKKRGIIRGVFL